MRKLILLAALAIATIFDMRDDEIHTGDTGKYHFGNFAVLWSDDKNRKQEADQPAQAK